MPMRFSSTDWVSSSQPPHVLPSLNLASTDGLPSMSRRVRMARTTVDRWRWPCRNSSSQSNPRMRRTSSQVLQHENDCELPHLGHLNRFLRYLTVNSGYKSYILSVMLIW